MRILAFAAAVAALCGLMLSSSPAQAQATRTWVSGVGDDANPCSRTAPCKTFAGAISKTASPGEIDCLDPGGFGTVTITKSITIDCTGTFGSILASATNGINVNGANAIVNIRGLSINGAGVTTGVIGINFIQGAALNLENVTIFGFNNSTAAGLLFAPSSANALLGISNSSFNYNGTGGGAGGGIVVKPAAGGNAVAYIHDSTFDGNSNGVVADSTNGSITMTVRESTIANNGHNGISSTAGSTIDFMVDRATISNNFQNGILSTGGNSTVRINASAITGNAIGVSGSGLRSYRNNAVQGNGNDNTAALITENFANNN